MMDAPVGNGQGFCPACGTGRLVAAGPENWSYWGVRYTLVQCADCGSATTDPSPDDSTVERVYRESFDYRWYRDHYDAKLADARSRITEYGERLGRHVIDFGGGLGYFSVAAKEAGYNSVTLDPFAEGGQSGDTKPADTVVALHVLEHSNDLDRTMQSICGLLKQGGHALIAVPNYLGTGYRSMGVQWVWAQPPLIHIHHFTAVGLIRLLERYGFSEFKVSYHDRWDANYVADVAEAATFHRRDVAWSRKPWARFSFYRRWVARRNARLRHIALVQSLGMDMPAEDRAELEVYARFKAGS